MSEQEVVLPAVGPWPRRRRRPAADATGDAAAVGPFIGEPTSDPANLTGKRTIEYTPTHPVLTADAKAAFDHDTTTRRVNAVHASTPMTRSLRHPMTLATTGPGAYGRELGCRRRAVGLVTVSRSGPQTAVVDVFPVLLHVDLYVGVFPGKGEVCDGKIADADV